MPIITAAVLGGLQSAAGIAQYAKGRQLAKGAVRPTYEIPKEIADNLSQAQMEALQGLPPEQVKQYVENVQRQVGFGLTALGERKAGIAGLATLTQQGTDAYKDLLSADAAARQANLRQLMNAREQMAGYKEKEFELNKLLPYQEQVQAAQAMTGAGMQNIMGGLTSAQGALETKYLADIYAGKGKGKGIGVGARTGTEMSGLIPAAGGYDWSMKKPQYPMPEQPYNVNIGQQPTTEQLYQFDLAKKKNPALTWDYFIQSTQGLANMIPR